MLNVPPVVVGVCPDGGGVGSPCSELLGARVLVLSCCGVGGGVLWGVVGVGGGLVIWLQQGPVHVGLFLLMLMLLQCRCSQFPQPVQRTEFDEHTGQK